jgi:hypothetical protein
MAKRTAQKPLTLTFEVPRPAPDGFTWYPHLLATIETAAENAGVTTRTVRNWLAEDPPLPAVYREGRAPLISIATLALWLLWKPHRDPDFGLHGGRRR